jgi:hypothetical protein
LSRSVPLTAANLGRRLLLVPILILAMFVVLVEATAAPPADRGPQFDGGGSMNYKPIARGDGRRMN